MAASDRSELCSILQRLSASGRAISQATENGQRSSDEQALVLISEDDILVLASCEESVSDRELLWEEAGQLPMSMADIARYAEVQNRRLQTT